MDRAADGASGQQQEHRPTGRRSRPIRRCSFARSRRRGRMRRQARQDAGYATEGRLSSITCGWRMGCGSMDFHPNPDVRAERLAGAGAVWDERLGGDRCEGRCGCCILREQLPQDVSIGFGLLATIKAGSHFSERSRAMWTGTGGPYACDYGHQGKSSAVQVGGEEQRGQSRSEFHVSGCRG